MTPFEYERAGDARAAVSRVAGHPNAAFLGGGTNLVDHLRLGVARPDLLVDVSRLPFAAIEELSDGGLRIGAAVRNSDLAAHPTIRERYPVLSQALLAGACGQLRNLATTGGNLLQRTRCAWFRDVTTPCNKREAGTGCSAIEGHNRDHAILGASEHCVAVHPSDMSVALAALGAVVIVLGRDGERRIAVTDLHRLPGGTPERDTVLERGDLITAVELPSIPMARNSAYYKVRERASFAFALVSVAAVLEVRDGRVADVRIALGGVAHKPWRALRAEAALRGAAAGAESYARAADAELADARPLRHNAFKIPLARNVITMVLERLTPGASS